MTSAQPLLGRRIVVTRPTHEAQSLIQPLQQAGSCVMALPTFRLAPTDPDQQQTDSIQNNLFQYHGLLFTSRNAVEFFVQKVGPLWIARQETKLPRPCVYALGEATAQKLREHGVVVDKIPEQAQARAMLALLEVEGIRGKHFLFPCSVEALDELPQGIEQAGGQITSWPVYQPVATLLDVDFFLQALHSGQIDAITVASPTAVRFLLQSVPPSSWGDRLFSVAWAAIGSTTASCLRDYGIQKILVADPPGISGLVRVVVDHFTQKEGVMSQDRWGKSRAWLERAEQIMPGGVNSPVRAFRSVGGHPPFICKAQGAYLWDEDGNRYIDYIGSWGPMILGHGHPEVVKTLQEAVTQGTSFGAPSSAEVLLAEKIQAFFPSMEMIRLVCSGTEATMSAIRLARAATQRSKIIKCTGCYHGHGDSFLIAAGSGAMTFGIPNSPGVTKATAADTLLAPYNNLDMMTALFDHNPEQIAAVILEPIPGNMGLVLPQEGYLQKLRTLTEQRGALLIFDEVMSGFRVAPGGAQELFGIQPDLTTLGKVIGGGLPVGAYGGKRHLMKMIAPSGSVYQAGTLSGNPLAVSAGLKTLHLLETTDAFQVASSRCDMLVQGIQNNLQSLGLPLTLTRYGSMFCLFFHPGPVPDYETAQYCDTKKFNRYFHAMLERGIHLPPSQFEAVFVSAAHSPQDIESTIQASREALQVAFA